MKRRTRNDKGAQIVELGPALIVLFLLILFPMIDLLNLALAYSAGWYCNAMVTREIATTSPVKADAAKAFAESAWKSSGLANFVSHGSNPNVQDIYQFVDSSNNPIANPTDPTQAVNIASVEVTTTMTLQPFLNVPLFGVKVSGLNAPFPISYVAQRPQEEKGLY